MGETLIELAERCEQATGPDREIDGAIDRLLHNRPKHGDYDAAEHSIWKVEDGWSGLLVRADGCARDSFCARRYTDSLDAALELIPDGCVWTIEADAAWVRWLTDDDLVEAQCGFSGKGGTCTALAVCATALRARAALEARR
jgi:hypothetical protein